MNWKAKRVQELLEAALVEDNATDDATTALTVNPSLRATATVLAKQDCVVCGLGCIPEFLRIFERLDGKSSGRFEVVSHPEMFDGVRARKGQAIAVIRHNARVLLACERVILNLMQRMSGVATLTREYVDAVKGTPVKVLDTRKTMPGMRMLDKYAVSCGGGVNHRLDLADGVLIKNNHIALGGGIETALGNAVAKRSAKKRIQVECRNRQEIDVALNGGADYILLDNMTPSEVKTSVEHIQKERPGMLTEASGGITLQNIRKYATTGVTFISVGALTHSAVAVDLSMRIAAEAN